MQQFIWNSIYFKVTDTSFYTNINVVCDAVVSMYYIVGITDDIFIDDNGDRDTSYTIQDMDPNTGEFRVSINTCIFINMEYNCIYYYIEK